MSDVTRYKMDKYPGIEFVLLSDYAKLAKRAKRLEEALEKFGEHSWNCFCVSPRHKDSDCTCGLRDALRGGGDE